MDNQNQKLGASEQNNGLQSNAAAQQGHDAYGQARQKTGEVIDQVQGKAGEVVDQIKEQATSQIATQKNKIADGMQSAAAMILMSGDQLRQNNQEGMAQYTDQVANKIDNFSRFLRERELGDLVTEVEGFAKREPVLFLGGAFTLGLLAARFLKTSNPSQGANQNNTALARRQADGSGASTHAPLTPPAMHEQNSGDYMATALQNDEASVARHFGKDTAAGQKTKPMSKAQSQNNNGAMSNADLL